MDCARIQRCLNALSCRAELFSANLGCAFSRHGAFFVVSGVANIVVAYTMSKDAWVNFKVMGLTAMSLIFVIGQVVVLRNHLVEPPGETAADEDGESTAAATPVVEPEA